LIVANATHWLKTPVAGFNPGLVAVIGAKGSGKTALADMLAVAANADVESGTASFVRKAREHLDATASRIEWASGSVGELRAARDFVRDDFGHADVKYLSQQFVEHLCSEDQLSTDLLREIEAVVFSHLDPSDRLSASSFEELRSLRTAPMHECRRDAEDRILELSDRISLEIDQGIKLPSMKERFACLDTDLEALANEIAKLVNAEQADLAEAHRTALQVLRDAQDRVATLKQRRQGLDLFVGRMRQVAKATSDSVAQLEQYAEQLLLSHDVLAALRPRSLDAALKLVADAAIALDTDIRAATDNDARPDSQGRESLKGAQERLKVIEAKLNLDSARKKRLDEAERALTSKKAESDKLRQEISAIEVGRDGRLSSAREERWALYSAIFDEIQKEEAVLREMYVPLASSLALGTEHEKKLEFSVRRKIDLDAWASRGEDLVDQRKRPRDQKTFGDLAREHILDAWKKGDAAAISAGITNLVGACAAHMRYLKKEVGRRDFARWLFSTEHISLEYGIGFDGVDLKNLSPGTKGIVLLILYLAVDTADRRPLVIDQPEENLDPKSVYEVLVPYFREAKRRRQIIIITHNANLVVNTDAEQIIVASAERVEGQALPAIRYVAGALEDATVRDAVCDVLEGGRRAFTQREWKYGFHQ
jgi:energy-coupling factor transporter ATP-binding protein EcfA2